MPDLKLLTFPDRPKPSAPDATVKDDVLRFCREMIERIEKGELRPVRFLTLIHAECDTPDAVETESYAVVTDYERIVMLEVDRTKVMRRILQG